MCYGNRLFQGITLKGYGTSNLVPEFPIIGGMALLFLVLPAMAVKDRTTA